MSFLAEVEAAFLSRLGRGLMLSAADIELVSRWERSGVPVEVVLEALGAAFDRPGLEPGRVRRLAFARTAVESAIEAWRQRGVGALGPVSPSTVVSLDLPRLVARLVALEGEAAPEFRFIFEQLRHRLGGLETWAELAAWAADAAWARMDTTARAGIESELERSLGRERRLADPLHFAETWEAQRRRLVRERLGLPDPGDLGLGT